MQIGWCVFVSMKKRKFLRPLPMSTELKKKIMQLLYKLLLYVKRSIKFTILHYESLLNDLVKY